MPDISVKGDEDPPIDELSDLELAKAVYVALRPDFRQQDVAGMIGIGQPHWSRIEAWIKAERSAEEFPALEPATRAGMVRLLRGLGGDPEATARALGTRLAIQRFRKTIEELEATLPPALRRSDAASPEGSEGQRRRSRAASARGRKGKKGREDTPESGSPAG